MNIEKIQQLDDSDVIGLVKPFANNNTRYAYINPEKLEQFSELVCKEYRGREWVTVAVTPQKPLAVYPTTETPIESDSGIALAPGLYPEEYDKL